jgi:uncharacterized protein (DUF486 family)
MIPLGQYIVYTILAAVCAFLKLFYVTNNYTIFIILGIVFSILEFIIRIPTKTIGLTTLGMSVISMQIVWVGMNLLISSILGIYLYKEFLDINKIIGMIFILLGIYIGSG